MSSIASSDPLSRPAVPQEAQVESDLVTRVQGGDVDAYGDLMKRHVREVRAYLASRVPARHLVDEVTHEAFVVAFTKIDTFRSGTSFSRWIRAIAWQVLRREVKTFSVRESHHQRLANHLALEKAEQAPLPNDVLDDLERCLTRVPSTQRKLLDLKYREGLSTKEMATTLSQSGDWVRTTLYRIRQQLRDCLNQSPTKSQ